MNVEIETMIEILPSGVIQVIKDSVYYVDGDELTRKRHRSVLIPSQWEQASLLLDEYYMNIVKSVWTDEVIEKYKASQNSDEIL